LQTPLVERQPAFSLCNNLTPRLRPNPDFRVIILGNKTARLS
jgi:hypothetical protein